MPSAVTVDAVGSYPTISPLPALRKRNVPALRLIPSLFKEDFAAFQRRSQGGGIFLLHCLSPWATLRWLAAPGR